MFLSRNRSAFIVVALLSGVLPGRCAAPQAYKWSVQYLIDNSQSVFDRSQQVYPRANRALAISPDGNYLYAGYIQSFNNSCDLQLRDSRMTNSGEVRKIDLRVADYEDATKEVLPYHRAKAIAVDDQNHVYLAEGQMIEVYDADLKQALLTIPMQECDGVAVTREGGDTVLYATERRQGELHRFLIDTRWVSGGCKATPAGLGGNGVMKVSGSQEPARVGGRSKRKNLDGGPGRERGYARGLEWIERGFRRGGEGQWRLRFMTTRRW